uniref:efflux RND transporter permease subunit n=1 Tax=Vibrio cholerae TaxID=666 RepID=UPI003F58136C
MIRQAVIVTPYPGATAQEVSDEVTDVIEGAVQALQELKEVKSVSMQGRSEVTVEIKLEFAKSSAQLQQVWAQITPQSRGCAAPTASRCGRFNR